MSTWKELADSKVSITIKEKESVLQSILKDVFTFSFIIFCIYLSQGSTWWTMVTGFMFMLAFWVKVQKVVNGKTTTFDSKSEAIDYINSKIEDVT